MKFFISHSSKNRDLVALFVELLHSKLCVDESDIYCTSIQNQVKLGKNFIHDIRDNLKDAGIVFFIITEDYLSSVFCLMEMGAAWAYKDNIIPILVPPVTFDTLAGTPLAPIQAYSLSDPNDIGTILYDNLIECNAIERLSRTREQEFLLSLPDFVRRINYCLAEMSGKKQIENATYLAITQNGNDHALKLRQNGNTIEMSIDFSYDPLYGPCSFVSVVTQFYPHLNWCSLQNTQSSIMYRLISPDESVKSVTFEVKSTDRLIKCFDQTYALENGKRDIIIKLNDIANSTLLREIAEVCIVVRPNDVPTHKGCLLIEPLGMHWS